MRNYCKRHPHPPHPAPPPHHPAPPHPAPPPPPATGWTVPGLCASYRWPQNLSGGGVIAIVELGGGWVQSDIDQSFSAAGQPPPSITDVSADGSGSNNGDPNDPASGEVALDIQVAGQAYYVATGKPAIIRVYWCDNTPTAIATGIRAATKDGCDVCSISWGADESNWTATDIADLEAAAQEAVTAGMVVFAASGDNDSNDGGGTTGVDAPASCPHVAGCGGTRKTATNEIVWNTNPGRANGEGTGGGFSNVFPVQPWQVGGPLIASENHGGLGRMVPDVCANADPATGYWIVLGGRSQMFGGTSAVAPLYAGLFAAFGTKLGFITDKFYLNLGSFNDITQGNNGVYTAGVGPDPCSGVGSPIGVSLQGVI